MNTNNLDHLSPVWTHLTHIQPERAEGIYLYDAVGNRYTDFTCGIGVTNTGHCHPRVVQAIQEQAKKLIFGQMNIVMITNRCLRGYLLHPIPTATSTVGTTRKLQNSAWGNWIYSCMVRQPLRRPPQS